MSSDKLVRPVLVALDVPVLDVPHREIQTIKLCLPLFPSHAVKFWSWPWLRLLTFVAYFDIRWHRNAPSLSSKHSLGLWPNDLVRFGAVLEAPRSKKHGELMWAMCRVAFVGKRPNESKGHSPSAMQLTHQQFCQLKITQARTRVLAQPFFVKKTQKNTMWFSFSSMPFHASRLLTATVKHGQNKGHFARYAVAASCSPHVVLWSPHHFPI